MTPRTVLVLGANGRFGAAAVAAFAAAGWRVLAQARRRPASLPPNATHLPTPLDHTDALVAAAAGAQVVVYAVNPTYTAWDTQLLPLARLGMDVAERLGALFMLPGNVYNLGEHMPALLGEDTPPRPSTGKGRLRVALEQEIQARTAGGTHRPAQGPLRAVVIRAGDFYGAGTGSWLDLAVVKSLAAGKLVYPGPLDKPHAWAYLPDLARSFAAVAERLLAAVPEKAEAAEGAPQSPAFQTFHFPGHTLTGTELLDAVQQAAADIGAVQPRVQAHGWRRGSMPWGVIRMMGWLVPMMAAIAEMRYLWQVPHALDGTRLTAFIGNLPATPVRVALEQALTNLGLGDAAHRPDPALASPVR